ncbi:5-methyltetrahydropteroyltriglutamate--homocysteine S-methyltransferase [Edaphobacter albus]|uniref:5-methyltetrahydropteroyltriglutamate-- homocysteine S-methyltransferase n=1 Tax=Edaphobacter sp. 4G125 TaxID=2763071 RepID=UPI001648AA20|nr:5-methyltetrahydropteroyltriglutamate--homocysteine S-methyltransferase [Edaphobacter sp. 4G125]QNI35761.1 5-methyltetrahydropteroyltriglutamate--homocysteine S-methyltransferase [Edaphobacter sp. 4G125]
MAFPKTGNLGFPRMGAHRELKFALEGFWSGKQDEASLLSVARQLRTEHWKLQHAAGITTPPSNDFSLYDHVLDMVATLGAIPKRYAHQGGPVPLATYFAMARGSANAPAMEMTKWFDTNYHYVVPEFEPGMKYALLSAKVVDDYLEAKSLGIETRPVLLGPVSFVLLGKPTDNNVTRTSVLEAILPLYSTLLSQLQAAGAEWVQIDEPCLCLDLNDEARLFYQKAYAILRGVVSPKLMLTTYFGDLAENLDLALSLGTEGLHLDLVRAPQQLEALTSKEINGPHLSLGLIDGRNVWRTDLDHAVTQIESAVAHFGADKIQIAPSCSLLHSPVDLDLEHSLDPEIRSWMAFAKQKLDEVVLLARSIGGKDKIAAELQTNAKILTSRRSSPRIHREEVQQRLDAIDSPMLQRHGLYPARRKTQEKALALPFLPTTTIGSFPQTTEVRKARAASRAGKLDAAAYENFLRQETERCIRFQESAGLDVLVHGEFERNDMVEYFGEQLEGFVFTSNGWVQSYGSRCVKPPVIFGDVFRPQAMTVQWSTYAQSLTSSLVKGMLTGPVTILQWSFVRDDQPRAQTCQQIALAIRDEVQDLEAAGIKVIQIDEPAIREGLPLRRADWPVYLAWSVDCFRLATSVVRDETQIHTHMCYSEFNDIMDAIVRMDADVISIECSRSRMELLDAFHRVRYPNEIGPGVYDIHSPRIPSGKEMEDLLRKALEVLTPQQLWVNPDCGLKTRGWEEVRHALTAMVHTAKQVRASLSA